VPKFERTYTDIATDNFYDPSSDVFSAQPSSSRPRDSTNKNVQRALRAAQYARSQEPLEPTTRYESPYKQGSPYSRVNPRQSHPGEKIRESDTKSIAPGDVLLDVVDHSAGSSDGIVAEDMTHLSGETIEAISRLTETNWERNREMLEETIEKLRECEDGTAEPDEK
jgi:hypothetical protein